MGLFMVWRRRRICIVVSLCKHPCKEVCDVKPGIDPYSLLARSCNRWWPGFVTSKLLWLKRGKRAQCVSNRCKVKRKKYFGVRCTLTRSKQNRYLLLLIKLFANSLLTISMFLMLVSFLAGATKEYWGPKDFFGWFSPCLVDIYFNKEESRLLDVKW